MIEDRDDAGLVICDDDLGLRNRRAAGIGYPISPHDWIAGVDLRDIGAIWIIGNVSIGIFHDGDMAIRAFNRRAYITWMSV